jgi:N-methylhydantoinase B
MTDASAGGSGACGSRDGTDSGGSITSLATSIPNVEATERSAPVLFFYRRERRDGGGAGQFRGGVGGECAYALYGTEGDTSATLISHGVEVDPSSGIAGGQPSSRARASIVRNIDVSSVIRDGTLATETSSPLVAKERFILRDGDVFVQAYPGGSGYGDPRARSLDAVENDLRDGVIDAQTAGREYGVLIDAEGHPTRSDEVVE